MPGLIDTTSMPGDTMSPASIKASAANLRTVGARVSARGDDVLARWKGLSAVYEAPEDATLITAMGPVKTRADAIDTDLDTAAKALDTFAEEVRTIKAEVVKIRADAAALLGGIVDGKVSVTYYGGGDYYTEPMEWDTDQATVDANNALIRRTNDQQEALWAAERACATAIRAAVRLGPVRAAGSGHPGGYGTRDIPDEAPMPWGATSERTESCLEHAGEGVAGAAGSVLLGLGNRVGVGYSEDQGLDWSLWTAAKAYGDALQSSVGLLTSSIPGWIVGQVLPGPVGQYLRDAQFALPASVAGLVALDLYAKDPLHKWKEDPARSSGEGLFNAAALAVGPKVAKTGPISRLDHTTPPGVIEIPSKNKFPDKIEAEKLILADGSTTLPHVNDRDAHRTTGADHGDWPVASDILQTAGKGKGNFGLGSASTAEANRAGEAWVGEGWRWSSGGKAMVSQDGLRVYRPPTYKPGLGKYQANFEWRDALARSNRMTGNGHLDITDVSR